MKNLNSGKEFLKSPKRYDYFAHYQMPKIRINKPRRRKAYQGIVNIPDSVKVQQIEIPFNSFNSFK